jgi:membrane dipeptidase
MNTPLIKSRRRAGSQGVAGQGLSSESHILATQAGAPGQFDFGLSAEQEARAAQLHRESIVIDLLSQHAGGNIFAHYPQELKSDLRATVTRALSSVTNGSEALAEVVYWPYEMSRLGKSDLIREWFQISGLTCGPYDIGVHDGNDPLWNRWEATNSRYSALPWLRYVTTAAEIRQAKRDGVVAFYANCQPESPAPRDLRAVDAAYARGLRSFTLTYNRMDHIGVGCTERVDAGLSMFGVEVVQRCNKIGMIVDVSHCGHLTTLDACRHSKKPVNANHTAARSLYAHARGKSNEALRAIADTGGVIGVVAAPFFLTAQPRPTIDHMLDHIDYISTLVGWQHVAIGTDWPMQAPDELMRVTLSSRNKALGFREEDHIDPVMRLIGFEDCRDLPNITRGLVKRGYSDEQIRGILGENALRVFEEVWD